MGDRQAQACARLGGATTTGAALKGQEDTGVVLGCNANAGVYHLKPNHLAPVVHVQGDAALCGEPHRIAQEVDQDLSQPLRIRLHIGRQASTGFEVAGQALGGSLRTHHVHELVQECG